VLDTTTFRFWSKANRQGNSVKQRYEIILAGSGGQGLVFTGRVLGQAAILEGKNVVQTQSATGDAQRGGLSVSELIIDKDEIIYQQVEQPDLILALSESAFKKYGASGTTVPLFYDSSASNPPDGKFAQGFPFAHVAESISGGAANMVALGTIVSLLGVVQLETLIKFMRKSFSDAVAQANIKSVEAGAEVAKSLAAGK
jgi:2-oxoglutarate ferredoxin oxidoreductase subunit gamma